MEPGFSAFKYAHNSRILAHTVPWFKILKLWRFFIFLPSINLRLTIFMILNHERLRSFEFVITNPKVGVFGKFTNEYRNYNTKT